MWHRVHPKELMPAHKTGSTSPSDEEVAAHGLEGIDSEKSAVNTHQDSFFNELSETATAERDAYLGKGSPSKKQFGFFTPTKNPIKTLAWDFWIPWRIFAFPIVEFAAFVVSWSAQFPHYQSDSVTKLRGTALQLLQPDHWLHELCSADWLSDWSRNQWQTLGLDRCTSDEEESWHQRTRDEIAGSYSLRLYYASGKFCRCIWISA